MKDNILIDDTIKIFENGVQEISKLKSSIIKLNDTVKELTDFDEIIDLQIDSSKVEDINKKLDITIKKYKEVLSLFENSISTLNEENKLRSINIKSGMEEFYKEVEIINENLNSIDFNINNNKITNLFKSLSDFINSIESKYKEISKKYIIIEELYKKVENLLSILNRVNNIIENSKLDKQIVNTLNKINKLDLKYSNINESIDKFNEHINKINNSFADNSVELRADKILKDMELLNETIDKRYKKIESEYNDINLLKEQINNTYKEKLESLEKKIDLLVDENKALKLAYSTREVEDNAFKDEILNLIKESMSTIDKNYIEVQSDDIENLKKLAKKGDIHASFKLGQDYYYGNNINKNVDLAVKYYKIGAKCNHSQSIKELMKIYTDEATNGNIKYQRILGMEYLKGSFIDVNIEEAIKWLTAASENGSLEAKNKLNKIKTEYNK